MYFTWSPATFLKDYCYLTIVTILLLSCGLPGNLLLMFLRVYAIVVKINIWVSETFFNVMHKWRQGQASCVSGKMRTLGLDNSLSLRFRGRKWQYG